MSFRPLRPTHKLLLGPGPASVDPEILRAASLGVLGYLDPEMIGIMDDTMELLRRTFRTKNELTLVVPGTGMAGMEAAVYNLVEPGDRVVVATAGFFGDRIVTVAERAGGEVTALRFPWGGPVDPVELERVVRQVRPAVLALVHAETSTGVLQPMAEISRIAREGGCLLLLDCVTSLAGCPVEVDEWGVDVAYSGAQKCLGALPGLAPITLGPRARAKMASRQAPVRSWYLDLGLIEKYWLGSPRAYHHTSPVNMVYALYEALRLAHEEGLEQRFARHRQNALAFRAGARALGLAPYSPDQFMLPPLTPITIPGGVDDGKLRAMMLDQHGIEIGGGLGDAKGKIWRVGLMGYGSQQRHVLLALSALAACLTGLGHRCDAGAAVGAALGVYASGK